MKFKTSNKTAVFGKKPYIKKNYYPAQLLKVEPYNDRDGNLVEGKYGHQLIFEFAIYSKDENDAPVAPMMFHEEGKDEVPVKISKFVYHEYKDKTKPGKFQTAFTPNSAVTKLCQSLGWTFSDEDIDIDQFIGNWVEANIDDYKVKDKEGVEYTASSIKDINPYEGPEVTDVPKVKATEKPKKVEKQMNHDAVEKADSDKIVHKEQEEIDKLKSKIEDLKKLNKEDLLTDEGLNQAVEQLESKIEELEKK